MSAQDPDPQSYEDYLARGREEDLRSALAVAEAWAARWKRAAKALWRADTEHLRQALTWHDEKVQAEERIAALEDEGRVCSMQWHEAREQAEAGAAEMREALSYYAEPAVYEMGMRAIYGSPYVGSAIGEDGGARARAALALPAGRAVAVRLRAAEALVAALGHSTPWPVEDVLTVLANAADHLRHDHDCDCAPHEGRNARCADSHERRKYAADAARQIAASIGPALRALLATGGG